MMKFLNKHNKHKKNNRQSLIIENFNVDNFKDFLNIKRRNSFSDSDKTASSVYSNFNEKELCKKNTNTDKKDSIKNESTQQEHKKDDDHKCNLCENKQNVKDNYIILTCGHIYHIRCLVENHYTDSNKYGGVIDEEYFNSRCCLVCNKQMEMEDILYIHNKFYKNTKEYLIKQQDDIERLDKQITKLKDELRNLYEYRQKLERQKDKSKQITVTINTLM